MTDAGAGMAEEVVTNGSLAAGCAGIFRETFGSRYYSWSDERLLREPLEALDLDSLTLLEFVMAIEEAYSVELDEDDVNRCETVGDLVKLVAAARNGSSRV